MDNRILGDFINEFLWFATLGLSFSGVLLFYKAQGRTGLYVWIALSTILCNIQTTKIVDVFGLQTSLGTVLYGSTFLANDILNEIYGNKAAHKTVFLGFAVMTTTTILMSLALMFVPSASDFASESLNQIFSLNFRITVASIIAFLVSQSIDVILYNSLRKTRGLWVRNNVSTIVSQIVDTWIFVFLTYAGSLPLNALSHVALTMLILKIVVAILDTPFIYFSRHI